MPPGLLSLLPAAAATTGLLNPVNAPAPNVSDVDMLARLIYSEAGGESKKGQQAIANVIWNRKNQVNMGLGFDAQGTISDVITAENQFEGYDNKSYRNAHKRGDAWDQAKAIARAQLSGNLPDITNGLVFYRNPKTAAKTGWFQENVDNKQLRPRMTIGNHVFYNWWPKELHDVTPPPEKPKAPKPPVNVF